MKAANSFKQMMEEDQVMYPTPPEIEENIMGSLRILEIMGKAMELYIPKAFEMFIMTLGGTMKEMDKAVGEELPEGDPGIDSDDRPPGIGGSSSD